MRLRGMECRDPLRRGVHVSEALALGAVIFHSTKVDGACSLEGELRWRGWLGA